MGEPLGAQSDVRGMAPSPATHAPAGAQPASVAEQNRQAIGSCVGLLNTLAAQKRYDLDDTQAQLEAAFRSGGVLTQDEWEEATGLEITDEAWRGLGGSLMETDEETGELVFTSPQDLQRALEHFQTFSQITGISLSYFCHCDQVTIVNSEELVAWMDSLSSEQLSQMCHNRALAPVIEAVLERALDGESLDRRDGEPESAYFNRLENALITLRTHPQKRDYWNMLGVALLNQLNNTADENDMDLSELNLQDPLAARHFLNGVFSDFIFHTPAAETEGEDAPVRSDLTAEEYSGLEQFAEQIGQLRTIVNGAPVRTEGSGADAREITLDDLDPDSEQFQDVLGMELTEANRPAIMAALARCPLYVCTPAHIQPPAADPTLSPITAAPSVTGPHDVEQVDPEVLIAQQEEAEGVVHTPDGPVIEFTEDMELQLDADIDAEITAMSADDVPAAQLEEPVVGAGAAFAPPSLTHGFSLTFHPAPGMFVSHEAW